MHRTHRRKSDGRLARQFSRINGERSKKDKFRAISLRATYLQVCSNSPMQIYPCPSCSYSSPSLSLSPFSQSPLIRPVFSPRVVPNSSRHCVNGKDASWLFGGNARRRPRRNSLAVGRPRSAEIPAASCEDARLTSLTQLLVFRGRISAPRSPSTGARAAIAAHACPIGYCATGCIVTGVAGILKVNRRVRTGTGSGKIGALWWFVFIRRCFYGEGVLRDLDQGGSRVMIELVSDVKL